MPFKEEIMKKLLKFVVIPVLATVLSLTAAGVAQAGRGDVTFGYHFGDAFLGCAGVLPRIPVTGMATCRPEAKAEDFAGAFPGGGSIVIQGGGELVVSKRGKPLEVDGGGLFARFDENGRLLKRGTWEARQLLLFDAYGEGTPGRGLESGRALIRIRLKPEGGKKVDAVLEIGCRLDGNKGIFGTIEGVRVMVDGGLNYNLPADPKLTVFVNLQNFGT